MAFLNLKDIIELLDRVADRRIGLLEIESAGMRVRIEGPKADASAQTVTPLAEAEPASALPVSKPVVAVEEIDDSWHVITSPIVGTYYEAPNPEADPFIHVGDHVSKGDVLCIIEAMKLMNEIESDVAGEIVRIFPRNAQPIEYGESLFALKLS